MQALRRCLPLALVVSVAFSAVPSSAQVLAESTFDTNDDGWRFGGSSTVPGYSSTSGNPGGHIWGWDSVGVAPGEPYWAFFAPSKFLGDQSAAYGGELSFDLRQLEADGSPFDNELVVLLANGTKLVYDNGINPTSSWTSYSVPLIASPPAPGKWLVDGGGDATEGEIRTVLASLTGLWIRGEFIAGGPDECGLDNVVLTGAAVPTMAFQWLTGLGGLLLAAAWLALRRKRATHLLTP